MWNVGGMEQSLRAIRDLTVQEVPLWPGHLCKAGPVRDAGLSFSVWMIVGSSAMGCWPPVRVAPHHGRWHVCKLQPGVGYGLVKGVKAGPYR